MVTYYNMCDFPDNTLAAELKNPAALFLNFHSEQIAISYSYNLLVQDLSFV